jgi:hypothetical protein
MARKPTSPHLEKIETVELTSIITPTPNNTYQLLTSFNNQNTGSSFFSSLTIISSTFKT